MRPVPRCLSLLGPGLSLMVAWPSRSVRPRAAPPPPYRLTRSAAPSFPAHVVRELAALRAGTTPTAWLRAHPWLEAWRLLAGLPPTATYFFCVYD